MALSGIGEARITGRPVTDDGLRYHHQVFADSLARRGEAPADVGGFPRSDVGRTSAKMNSSSDRAHAGSGAGSRASPVA
ncbi:hypothetical protein [Rhizocola hellebori]|uniref:hypothetical protein n=1 Tax=Rhizocola hellebori TaxID=1392758 RepID=UPI0019424272|nr:hypothetical protein [Rhizocola hellebori]